MASQGKISYFRQYVIKTNNLSYSEDEFFATKYYLNIVIRFGKN